MDKARLSVCIQQLCDAITDLSHALYVCDEFEDQGRVYAVQAFDTIERARDNLLKAWKEKPPPEEPAS